MKSMLKNVLSVGFLGLLLSTANVVVADPTEIHLASLFDFEQTDIRPENPGAGSANASQLTKSVDKAVAGQQEILTYDITISNLTLSDPIHLVDVIPDGAAFVAGSESAIVNGVPDPSFTYDSGTNSLTWSGLLDTQTLELAPSPSPFGYIPLNLFVAPLPCTSVCDDTSITLSGIPGFDFAGQTYTSVVMSTNGLVVADSDAPNAFSPFNQGLPDPAAPNNLIAPFWTDLDLDGTSPTDSGAGIWYAALLSAGANTYLVLEWENVELFGVPGFPFTFQVWIEQGSSNIWMVYAAIPGIPAFLTVGVEDVEGVAGSSYYFDGSGTPPAVGTDLQVNAIPGGVAEFTFQVQAGCDLDPIINIVDVTSGAAALRAYATTEIVPGPDNDGDGVPDECSDVCFGTVIPESVPTRSLKPNRYALVDGDTIFDTVGHGGEVFTTEDTAGCSCEQIIDALHLGKGHEKHGCSIGKMRRWVRIVNP